ncbi:hypothetical protein Asulf_00945 [Archaeoglobus sulfaticallidus PM70-1]|uniref:Uncharacterized protein n=1 Tax=Archaeoglobus sulfaticallidus PM70-1 TaxID=387631 RepID=N0BBH4_9EURY|nr:hypothetical protein [Archaeoglobus sulfaticallidus]AGK60949.1 hypothetical protein Asulf_00945 [Archaeoglobus sulfaticallidus PM70-1]
MEKFSNFFKAFDLVKASFAITLILAGVYVVYPDLFQAGDRIWSLLKVGIAVAASIAGIYIVYNTLEAKRGYLTVGDLAGTVIGMGLMFVGLYLMLGEAIENTFTGVAQTVLQFVPYGLSAISMFAGIQAIQKNRKERAAVFIAIAAIFAIVSIFKPLGVIP